MNRDEKATLSPGRDTFQGTTETRTVEMSFKIREGLSQEDFCPPWSRADFIKNTLTLEELCSRWNTKKETILRGMYERFLTCRQINPKEFKRWWKTKNPEGMDPESNLWHCKLEEWNTFYNERIKLPLWFDVKIDVVLYDELFTDLEHRIKKFKETIEQKPIDLKALKCFVLTYCKKLPQLEAHRAMEVEEGWSSGTDNPSKRKKVGRAERRSLELFKQYNFLSEEELQEVSDELKARGGQK
jgi:hypothetical protein